MKLCRNSGKLATLAGAAVVFAAVALLDACVPVVVGASVGAGALVASDRRSTGAQIDDETIEIKIASAVSNKWGDTVHLNATSYNGIVLLTGEAPSAAARSEIAELAKTIDRVRAVHNEMVVGLPTNLSTRTNDTYLTSKVKTGFVEANKFSPTRVKVVTERGVVYLMGIVSKDEADTAARIAATTIGVTRVVRIFEYSG